MMRRLIELFTVAKHVFQREGLSPLLRQGFVFLAGYFFRYETYYLYKIDIAQVLKQNSEADLLPKIRDLTLKIVFTNEQADKLAGQGFEFRSLAMNDRKRLDKGAIAFCIFTGQELASIGWVALTQQAKDSLDEVPLIIGFSNKESYTGRMGQMMPVEQIGGSESLKGDFVQIDKEGNPIEGGIHSSDASFSLEVIKDQKTKTAFMARQSGDSVDLDIRKAFPNDTEVASLLKIDKTAVAEIVPSFRFTITASDKLDSYSVACEVVIPLSKYVKGMLNPRFPGELGLFGYLIALLLQVFPKPNS